jgi:hypothetical protein
MRIRWARHVVELGETRNTYTILVDEPEGKRSVGRHNRRNEYNIKEDHTVIEC